MKHLLLTTIAAVLMMVCVQAYECVPQKTSPTTNKPSSHAPLAQKRLQKQAQRGKHTELTCATRPKNNSKTKPTRETNQAHMRHSPEKTSKTSPTRKQTKLTCANRPKKKTQNKSDESNKPSSHKPLAQKRLQKQKSLY